MQDAVYSNFQSSESKEHCPKMCPSGDKNEFYSDREYIESRCEYNFRAMRFF